MASLVHRDVTAGRVRLRVAERGDGPPVVLLHDLFVDHQSWSDLSGELSREFRLIAPDLPGFGESEKPPLSRFSYGIDAFAESATDLYGALRLGRAALVGHGLGGAIAITLAARHPELVEHLVLIDTLCFEPNFDLQRRLALLPVLGGLVFKQLLGRTMFRSLLHDEARQGAAAKRVDHYYEMFNSPAARGSALATLRATVDTRSVVARLGRIATPTLVIWGRSDRLYPAGYGQRLAKEIRGAGFELLDAGHAPHEEQPEHVARVIGRFLRHERTSIY